MKTIREYIAPLRADKAIESAKELGTLSPYVLPGLGSANKDADVSEIVEYIAAFFDLQDSDIYSKSRTDKVSLAKEYATAIIYKGFIPVKIRAGKILCVEHSTVIDRLDRFANHIELEKEYKEVYLLLCWRLYYDRYITEKTHFKISEL